MSCPCNLIVRRCKKGKRNGMKGIIYAVDSIMSQSTLNERCPLFCWNVMANYHCLPRWGLPVSLLVTITCMNCFTVHSFPSRLSHWADTALCDRCDQKPRLICASQVLSTAVWKQQPEIELPQMLILASVVFSSTTTSHPVVQQGLCFRVTQHSSMCRGRVLTAH